MERGQACVISTGLGRDMVGTDGFGIIVAILSLVINWTFLESPFPAF